MFTLQSFSKGSYLKIKKAKKPSPWPPSFAKTIFKFVTKLPLQNQPTTEFSAVKICSKPSHFDQRVKH
jgi:hypothetical protein